MGDIKIITEKIRKFRDERDWMQFHDPKNMAVSIILEASELLEHFQWKTTEEVEKYVRQNHAEIKDEIADIALYLFELADNLDISLINAMEDKLKKNEMKYPVEKAKGKHTKYNKLEEDLGSNLYWKKTWGQIFILDFAKKMVSSIKKLVLV